MKFGCTMALKTVLANLDDDEKILFFLRSPLIFLTIFSIYIPYVNRIRRNVKNWPDVFLVTRGIKKSAQIEFVDGNKILMKKHDHVRIVSYCEFLELPKEAKDQLKVVNTNDSVQMTYEGRKIVCKTEFATSIIIELYGKSHELVDVKNRIVVDAGAYIGDTAIYYILAGKAKAVYGLEMDPRIYVEAKKLIKSNKLEKRIHIFGAGIAPEGNLDTEDLSIEKMDKIANTSENMKTISLDKIVKLLKINSGVLKIDVEGMEYDIFKKASSDALRSFNSIHIEYHYGYKQLVDRLNEEGFEVTFTKPYYRLNFLSGAGVTCQGDIVATRG